MKVLIGLSGGINSMAVLCWLAEQEKKPKEVHLFYAHFKEHSPDTFKFIKAGIKFAQKNFEIVKVKITRNSILDFFNDIKMIPHPSRSVCTQKLKIEPINKYAFENDIKIDLVGYVKHELKRRTKNQKEKNLTDLFSLEKIYPIGEFSDEWCFSIVNKYIGFYPKIYDLVDETGKKAFKHNNCLPCKNMETKDFENVKKFYPKYYLKSIQLSSNLSLYWGRDSAEFYTKFQKDLGLNMTCETCNF